MPLGRLQSQILTAYFLKIAQTTDNSSMIDFLLAVKSRVLDAKFRLLSE